MKILVTGFEPFGNDTINPSIEAVKRLPDKIGDKEIIKVEVPCVAYESIDVIEKAMVEHDVDYVLNVGQAGGRKMITFERVGINMDDYRIADNKGNMPIDVPIFRDGENAYFTTIPNKMLIQKVKEIGIEASLSNTAGTFVCNHVTYGVQYLIHRKYHRVKSGFIHIPFIPEQNHPEHFSMKLEEIIKALACVLEHIDEEDIVVSEGSIC